MLVPRMMSQAVSSASIEASDEGWSDVEAIDSSDEHSASWLSWWSFADRFGKHVTHVLLCSRLQRYTGRCGTITHPFTWGLMCLV